MKQFLIIALLISTFQVNAQTQSWQWIKAGGSNSDNTGINNTAAGCKIGGCDAKGNVYAMGDINGPNVVFDTFQSPGTYSSVRKNHVIFSYDCSGHMRWAKQVGDIVGFPSYTDPGFVTDVQGNSYLSCVYLRGFIIGDTTIDASIPQNYFMYLIKLDSLGKIVWVKNYGRDTASSANFNNGTCFGIRIGSSGNLWLKCYLDSNYALATTLHTNRIGNYQVEVNPTSGAIIGGYYIANPIAGSYDQQYDIDGNENYYEISNLSAAQTGVGPGDTLYLNGHTFAPDSSLGLGQTCLYSLDKQGNFRYLVTNTAQGGSQGLSCRYSISKNRLISSIDFDSGNIFGNDTFHFSTSNYSSGFNDGIPTLYCISSNGNFLWSKSVTAANTFTGHYFTNVITPNYISSTTTPGYWIYDAVDTIQTGAGSCTFNCTFFSRQILNIDGNGNILAPFNANLGSANPDNGDAVTSGATDWRGNLYMGGSITSYVSLPNGDSVSNTDPVSGNFFIAKIGISDCSCPTPGAQFSQISNGDTVYFYGSSINHRDSIHWEFGDGSIASGDTFRHLYSQSGTYNVTAIAYSGCGVDSITKQVTVRNVGIAVVEPDKTNLYPNPVSNAANLEVSGAARIGLVAANGTSMWDQPIQVSQSGTYVFDMGKYSGGLYYFIVEYTNGKVDVLQVVKK